MSPELRNKNLISSLAYLKEKNLFSGANGQYDSVEELEKEQVMAVENSVLKKLGDLKEKLSSLQKNGKDLSLIRLLLLEVPLKLKLWKATLEKKDAESIVDIFEKAEKEINEAKKE